MQTINPNENLDSVLYVNGKSFTILPEPDFDKGRSSSLKLLSDSSNQNKKYVAKILKKSTKENKFQFVNEIHILRHISHDQIVKYVTSGDCKIFQKGELIQSSYCIILEYYENLSLFHYLKLENEKLVKLIGYYLKKPLQFLHNEKKIAHRDIKPENIMLNNDCLPCLIDFGVCRDLNSIDEDFFPKCGTKSYRPPEIFTIENDLSENNDFGKKFNYSGRLYNPFKSDSFSYGVTLLVLLLGLNPFENIEELDEPNKRNLYLKCIVEGKFDKFWEIIKINSNVEISQEFKELFMKLVNVYPHKRPSIDEVDKDKWFDEVRNLSEDERMNLLREILRYRVF